MELKNKWNRIVTNRRKSVLLFLFGMLILAGGIVAYAATETGLAETEPSVAGIEYYAALDDEWQRIDMGYTVPGRDVFPTLSNQLRYYTTPDALKEIYGKLGFDAENYSGQNWFPHTAAGDSEQIWGDSAPVLDGDSWRIPLAKDNKIYVYYLPNGATYTKGSLVLDSTDGETALKNNMFYSISISDPDKKMGEKKAEVQYVKKGGSYEVTLPAADGYQWKCVNRQTLQELKNTKVTSTTNTDKGTVTFTATDIQEPLKFEPVKPNNTQLKIVYNAATVNDNLQEMGDSSATIQEVVTEGTINNQDSFTFYVDAKAAADTSLKLLSPDSDRALVAIPSSSQGKKFWYSFTGWRLSDTGRILSGDTTMTIRELRQYEVDGEIELDATWTGKNEQRRVNSANFYVNKNCEISDNMSDGASAVPKEGFTKSVYTAQTIDQCNDMTLEKDGSYLLLAPDNQNDNAYDVDASIRGMASSPYYTDSNGNTLGMREFPSDEVVLANLRANYDTKNPIKVDNQVIPKEDLTTANFKVRWYSAKYQKSDGWHVDGILVAKAGKVVIKKTFTGSADPAIQELKDTFNITVTHQKNPDANDPATEDYKLVLKANNDSTLDDGESGDIKETGYDSYDEATHTYTWILTVRDYQQYNIQEHNYNSNTFQRSEHRYTVKNPVVNTDEREDEDSGWMTYPEDDGITITADSYADDVPLSSVQTVELQNLYISSSFITLNKMDAFTLDGMKNVSFQVSKLSTKAPSDGPGMQIYRRPGTNVYSDSHDDDPKYGFTEKVSDNIIQTDNTGMIYLELSQGDYIFREQTPDGYQEETPFLIEIVQDDLAQGGSTRIDKAVPCDADGKEISNSNGYISWFRNSAVVSIQNKAEQLTTVTAKADMSDVTADSVVVELWCNGAKVSGNQYTQVLSAENNWTYTWQNLPLYADGAAAKYTLRETQIGDTAYDPGVNGDGYADYDVNYDDCKYRESDSGAYDKPASWKDDNGNTHYAKHALLTVRNARTVAPQQYVSVNVKVAWDDGNNQDGIRPANVNVKLLDGDGNQAGTERSLNADGNWESTFLQLNKYKADGKTEMEYKITNASFAPIEGYTPTITGNMTDGYTITFAHTPETVEISGTTVWDDNDNVKNKRPDSVTVNLLADGSKVDSKTVSASGQARQKDGWNWSFGSKPKYKDGKEIVYTISQDPVTSYTTSITRAQNQHRYTITNKYIPPAITPVTSSITDTISVKKTLEGRTLQDREFSFELLEGSQVVVTGTNDADGNVTFPALTYSEEGTHTYTLREHQGDDGGVTYDTKTYTVKTTVTEGNNGALHVTHEANGTNGAITFANTYKAEAATASITAVKHLTGGTLKDGAFTFQLKNEKGKVIDTAKNDGNGVIAFKELKFDEEGTYSYTVSEVNDKQKNITYDTSEKKVVITVKDNGHGELEASIESDGELSFTNTFTGSSQDPSNPGQPGNPGGIGGNGAGGILSGSGAKTGDSSDIALALGLMLIAATAGGILLVRRKMEQ